MQATATGVRRADTRAWLLVAAATVAWIAHYRTILPFWDWLVYEVGGLDPATRLGGAVHFFFYDVSKILLLLGGIVFLGAGIHGWLPEDLFARIAGPSNPFAVPLAVLLGVPLYTNVVGVIPLVAALQATGLAMGTLLAFMMSVVALSLPEMILLRRVLKPQLIAIFVAIVAAGMRAEVEKVEDIGAIMGYGVTATPALVVDERVIVSGRVPNPTQIEALLRGL